jgi:hypothetical protein
MYRNILIPSARVVVYGLSATIGLGNLRLVDKHVGQSYPGARSRESLPIVFDSN